jgi:uncharacterized protein YkwD
MFTGTTLCCLALLCGADAPTHDSAAKAPKKQPAAAKQANAESGKQKPVDAPAKKSAAAKEPQQATDKKDKEDKEAQKEEDAVLAIEQNIVNFTNAERARYGLPALTLDPALLKSARAHCIWMASCRSMVHSRQAVAENIAMGQQNSGDVVRCWMNSSGHRANILNRCHGRIGVAAYRAADGTIFWCQQFCQ